MELKEIEVREFDFGDHSSFATDIERQQAIVGLRRAIDLLVQDINSIDHQLGNLNATDRAGRRLTTEEWSEWRERAKAARRFKLRQVGELKDELRRVSLSRPKSTKGWAPPELSPELEELSDDGIRARFAANFVLIGMLKDAMKKAQIERSALHLEAEKRGLSGDSGEAK